MTLDGVTEAPERWQGPYMNQEVGQALAEGMAASDTILLSDLKQHPGKDILVNGSATLVRSLIASGTLDELSLLVHPIVVGGERRLFDGVASVDLHLVEAKPFANGVVSLTYRPQAR